MKGPTVKQLKEDIKKHGGKGYSNKNKEELIQMLKRLVAPKPKPKPAKKPCPPGKIRNPKTGRCVSKTGAVGKKLVTPAPKPKTTTPKPKTTTPKPKTTTPSSDIYGNAYEEEFLQARENGKILGEKGKEGYALVVKTNRGTMIAKVFKKSKSPKTLLREYEFSKKAGEHGIGPKVYGANTKFKYIMMEMMKETLPQALQRRKLKSIPEKWQIQIYENYKKLDELKIYHNDPNPLNFMLDKNDNMKLIDYGFARKFKKGDTNISSIGSLLYSSHQGLVKNKIVKQDPKFLKDKIPKNSRYL